MSKGPPALILDLQITALATAHCLADAGIQTQVASFYPATAEQRSNSFRMINAWHVPKTVDHVAEWLYQFATRTGDHPVVLPSSDTTALSIARHREELENVCTVWKTGFKELETIISKEGLYARATDAGIKTPPAIVEPELDELNEWCKDNPGPYLIKPFYQNIPSSKLTTKNLVVESARELLEFTQQNGSKSLIIQRLVRGGDGRVFDCYGLSNSTFDIVTQASHTRIRQFPRNFGTTSYGEIPARPTDFTEEKLFELTDQLLGAFEYHGIFGIEWIEDRETSDLFLIDFNARPFLSVGHLNDCGLNLPSLAYRELQGDGLTEVPRRPQLKHKFWIFFVNDCKTLRERLRDNEITWSEWLASILKARSFACWRLRDMGPSLHLLVRYFKSSLKSLFT